MQPLIIGDCSSDSLLWSMPLSLWTSAPRARDMMNKKVRNLHVAFPLAITSLCVAPQSYFLKHWQSFFEASVPKLKVRFTCFISVSISFSLQERSNQRSLARQAALSNILKFVCNTPRVP